MSLELTCVVYDKCYSNFNGELVLLFHNPIWSDENLLTYIASKNNTKE